MTKSQVKTLLLIAALSLITVATGLVCPPRESIEPAQCAEGENGLALEWGSPASPNYIEYMFTETRKANNLTADDWLPLHSLNFFNFQHNFLDFRPLAKSIIETMYISAGPSFYQIDGGALDASLEPNIKVTSLYTSQIPKLRDDGALQILSYLDSSALRSLHLNGAAIEGSCFEVLHRFEGLETLFAQGAGYWGGGVTFPAGAFSQLPNLRYINMAAAGITEIGENGLALSERGVSIVINLGSNWDLNSTSISPNNGLAQVKRRRIELDLADAGLDTLEADTWKEFLDNNPSNRMILQGVELFCDPRMRWIKDGRALYIEQVLQSSCANDRLSLIHI